MLFVLPCFLFTSVPRIILKHHERPFHRALQTLPDKQEQIKLDTSDITWLPSDEVYAEEVRHIMDARLESLGNFQRRKMIEMLEDIVLSSPFYQFTLMHSQVKGVLTDRRAVHVKDLA